MKIILFTIFTALLIIFLIKLCYSKEHFTEEKNSTPIVKRPFVNLYDNIGNRLNVILISKPFSGDSQYQDCLKYKKNNIILGISSYLEFPAMVSNPFENFTENYKKYKYKQLAEGWIHGFKNPDKFFSKNIPLLFASESDFIDCNVCKPDESIKKEYDFIYICLKVDAKQKKCDDWATWNKNWSLAKKCLDILCNKFKLKGLLVGRKNCELPNGCNKLMDTTDMLSHDELKKMYNKSKFIFIPNEKDASPRVLTEAMAINLPALINKNILGGWKYINSKTGEFFIDENDISKSLERLLKNIKNNQYEPRNFFVKNYSVINSGKRLKHFIYSNYSDRINIPEQNVDYITPEFSKKEFKSCEQVLIISK